MLRHLFNLGGQPQAENGIVNIIAEDLQRKIAQGEQLLILDVRSPDEYAHDGHIASSRLLPLPALAHRASELPRDRTIVCVCRSGARSQAACELLARQGFTKVSNLSGGMIGWRRAGLSITNG